MKLYELYENQKSDATKMMPTSFQEFEALWDQLKREADDIDDIQFFGDPNIKNSVHQIMQKDGYKMSMSKAIITYSNQKRKQQQKADPKPEQPKQPVKTQEPKQKAPAKDKPGFTGGDVKLGMPQLKGKLGDLQKAVTTRFKKGAKIADKFTKTDKK